MHNTSIDTQNISYSQQNILANSIRIARQKLGRISQQLTNNNDKEQHNQTFSFSKPKKQSSAAQAIKVLHNRIAELQAFNVTLTKQVSQSKRQINMKNLQIQSLHNQSTALQSRLNQFKEKVKKIQQKLKDKENEIQKLNSIQKQKDQMLTQQIKITDQIHNSKANLQIKVTQLNKRIDGNQKLIVQMIKQLQQEKSKKIRIDNNYNSPQGVNYNYSIIYEGHKNSKSAKSKQNEFPVIVDQPESQKDKQGFITRNYSKNQNIKRQKMIESQKFTSVTKRTNKIEKNIEAINKQLKQKNQQLYNMLRTAERKCKEEEKQKNIYKDRFYFLKNATDSIVQEISRLPQNLSHKFKIMIVKVKKIENENLQFLKSHSIIYGNRNNSKSSRHTSSQRSSKSKQKKLKMEDLNLSDHNMSQPRSHSKSRRRSITTYMKSNSAKKNLRKQTQTDKQNQIRLINRQIRQQRKQLCEIHKKINNQTNQQRLAKLKQQFQQKMNKNLQLKSELQAMRVQKL